MRRGASEEVRLAKAGGRVVGGGGGGGGGEGLEIGSDIPGQECTRGYRRQDTIGDPEPSPSVSLLLLLLLLLAPLLLLGKIQAKILLSPASSAVPGERSS